MENGNKSKKVNFGGMRAGSKKPSSFTLAGYRVFSVV
jgi:hypothetical protein